MSVAVLALVMAGAPAWSQQLPTGGAVAAGNATIAQPNASTLNINQSTNQAILNWQSFSVGQGGTVNFNQPNSSSATLNRVLGSTPSSIAGMINAPGTVLLVNPNGIAITKSGVINTGSFAASTLDIKDADFLAGNYKFTGNGGSAGVTNAGRINVSDGGFAALLGGQVGNSGVISARLGKVGLGAGELITLDFAGDGFLSVAVPSSEVGKLVDQNGALVTNSGKIRADGGQVFLSAATASTILRDAVHVPGSIRANTVGTREGRIVLGGGAGGKVNVTGKLAARTKRNAVAGSGGKIDISGHDIVLAGARFDVSGATGGGNVRIGGDAHGGGTFEHARTVSIDAASVIRADALGTGDGGNVVVWSDKLTTFAGQISARGGAQGGNGGFAEVSGKEKLGYTGFTNLRAAQGRTGTLLLDPYNVTISNGTDANHTGFAATGDDSVINVTTLVNALAGANVIVSTGFGGTQDGDITVADSVTWSAATTLTLNAAKNIFINADVTGANGNISLIAGCNCGSGNLTLNANLNAGPAGTVFLFAGGAVTQPGGGIVADAVTVSAATASLNSATNNFARIEGGTDGDFSATTSRSLTIGSGGVTSASGAVSLTALGTTSDINVPTGIGGIDVTLNAGSDIVVDGGVVFGFDTLSLTAGNGITVKNAGFVAGANVSLNAGSDILIEDGQVGGDIVLLTAGNDIRVIGCGCGGLAGNDIAVVAGRDILISDEVDADATVTLLAGRDLTLESNAIISSFGSGDAIVLSAIRNFINNAGAVVLDTSFGGGRWLIYANNPTNSTFGGLDSGNAPIWNATYASLPPASVPTGAIAPGNRSIFAVADPLAPQPPGPTNPPSQFIPPGNSPTNPGVNIAFQNPAGGPINVSFTPAPRTASNAPGTDISPASLPDGVALATNNGLIFLPISMYDANQYSQFALPGYADQAGLSAVFTMIARGVDGQHGSDYMIDTFWNGTAGAWKAGDPNLSTKATFSDGLGNAVAPNGQAGFPIVAGTTDFAAMLRTGPVMISSGGNPASWLLATQMTPDGKGIVANDPSTGKQIVLAYDPATKTVGGVTGVLDSNTKKFVPVAEAAAATTPADAHLSALQGFVASSYLAVTVK